MYKPRQGLKWVGTHGNAVPRPAISALRRPQASKSDFFCGNARSQAGKIVLSVINDYYSQFEFGQDNGLTKNIGGPLQNRKGPQIFKGAWILSFPLP